MRELAGLIRKIMSKKPVKPSRSEFSALFEDIKPIKNDKYVAPRSIKKKTAKFESAQRIEKRQRASFEFSDGFVARFDEDSKVSYARDSDQKQKLSALKKGLIAPEIELDLHGLNREDAKQEIAALIDYSNKHNIECVKIVHGVSGGVLKKYTPHWLVQHPLILGFHQAPKHMGGIGALLVLLGVPRDL